MSALSETVEPIGAEVKAIRTVEVRAPASTSNLGAGFDCCGLALKLYLSVTARVLTGVEKTSGENTVGGDLIHRALRFTAEREQVELPPMQLEIQPDIPFASGLGSSGAAIVAGISLCSAICELNLSRETILRYATALEGHADNVAATLLGGLVFSCPKEDSEVIAVKRGWPPEIKIIAVTPHWPVETKQARGILSPEISRRDAIYNLQRIALFGAALETQDYELLWEAMQDRLHQQRRAQLVPGLAEALSLPRAKGLLGLALSGSGPSVVALATENFAEIGDRLRERFQEHKLEAAVRVLEVDYEGTRTVARP